MAFSRKVELTIGTGLTGLLVSSLNIDFDVTRTNTKQYNDAKFKIYNAKEETQKRILTQGNNVVFKAGYADEGNIGIIYVGTVTNGNTKRTGPDYLTEILAMDITANREALLYSTITLSYKAGTLFNAVLTDISGQIGIPIAGIENVTNVLNNGFVFAGSFTNLIKRLQKILFVDGLQLYFDANEMVIFSIGKRDDKFGSAYITPKTGLIGEVQEVENKNEQDLRKRIKFDYLINPKLRPNSVVILKSEKVNGVFIVDKLRFVGNNYGGDFRCQIEASTSDAIAINSTLPTTELPLGQLLATPRGA